ncbi:TPA: hypothetical protein QCS34_004826, partial [Bacillus thuringiensis]|nr:hypothetical protein [Bacillus thuringiensis]
ERNTNYNKLGYRGINISLESNYISDSYDLPSSFSIANGSSVSESKGMEIAENLLQKVANAPSSLQDNSSIDVNLNKWIMTQIKNFPIPTLVENLKHKSQVSENIGTSCPYEKIVFDPDFWNSPEHLINNNCYNFATNQRTDSFAQPGRATGQMYRVLTCEEVTKGAIADGCQEATSCFLEVEAPRFLIALVIAPGPTFFDYHWYRQCSNGNWAHKPGQTPAVDVDNSNQIIIDPSIADRGDYTVFCGYMLSPKSVNVQ